MNVLSFLKKFFFENLHFVQIIFKNIFWLTFTEAIISILKFFLFVYIARILGANEYGKFSFALSFVNLFTIFADLGLSTIITREFSQNNKKEKEICALFSLKIILSFILFFIIFLGSFFITHDFIIQKIIWILAILTIAESFLGMIYAYFRARQKMEYESASRILEMILIILFASISLFYFPSALNLSLSYSLGALLALFLVLLLFHLKAFSLSFILDKTIWKKYLSFSWPVALTIFFSAILNNVDSVFLGYFNMITETGWYNAVKKIAFASSVPCGILSATFFPALSSVVLENREHFLKAWNSFLKFILIFIVPIVVGGIILSLKIIDFVYDPSFFSGNLAFRLLLIMVGLNSLSYPFNTFLLVLNKQIKIFEAIFFSTILNFISNLILIPKYSLNGAALSSLLSTLFYFIFIFKYTKQYSQEMNIKLGNSDILKTIIGIFFATIFMVGFILLPFNEHRHVLFTVVLAGIFYFLLLFWYNLIIKIF